MVTASSARYQVKGCLRLHANPGHTKLYEIRTISFLLTFCPRYNPKITRLIQCHPRKQFSATLLMTSRSLWLCECTLLRSCFEQSQIYKHHSLAVHLLCTCASVLLFKMSLQKQMWVQQQQQQKQQGSCRCGPRLCHVRLHAHCAHSSAQPKHLIAKILYTRHIYGLNKNCEHLFAGKGLE